MASPPSFRPCGTRPVELTAIVTTADDGGSSGDLRRRFGGPAVGDLRRSLIALSDGTNLLATVMSRPLQTRYGRHPVGNLLIQSLMDSLGDLESSSRWLAFCPLLYETAHVFPGVLLATALKLAREPEEQLTVLIIAGLIVVLAVVWTMRLASARS